ncbi:MAG: DNA recombination protein RmuC [Patescibacteria group bacterium]|nr:DNA recombination protein RmuC [Patescibacteria group bacterium]MDD4304080.1 DNA recombination protein RmuC [Patescibacteria group bacterium]MDD4694957.1 DNA recombination protein RmuC [Patescibacteria group bacterium]
MFINYLILILLIILIVMIYILLKDKDEKKDDQSFLMLQNQLSEMNKTLDIKLNDSNQMVHSKMTESLNIVKNVTESLTKLDETNKQVMGFAQQLQSLENILKNPKQRGILGEYYLETVLKNVLPPNSFQMQYKFNNGDIVDAVVFSKEGIIPIDSKFSLENYNKILDAREDGEKENLEKQFKQDLKNRIDETSKYIRPKEKTMEFAFMFIPSEAIYYDLLVNKVGAVKVNTRDLIEYAFRERKVIIVSPTTFLAYLQTVMQGLRALKIEDSIKDILKHVSNLQNHIISYEEYLKKLGNNLGTTVNMYNSAYKEFAKIDKDVIKITGKDTKIEPELIDKPKAIDEI